MLLELFRIKAEEADFENIRNIEKIIFANEFNKFIQEHQEIYSNLSKYIIFHFENKRVKCFQ
jgi:hypothetical protein